MKGQEAGREERNPCGSVALCASHEEIVAGMKPTMPYRKNWVTPLSGPREPYRSSAARNAITQVAATLRRFGVRVALRSVICQAGGRSAQMPLDAFERCLAQTPSFGAAVRTLFRWRRALLGSAVRESLLYALGAVSAVIAVASMIAIGDRGGAATLFSRIRRVSSCGVAAR